MSKALEAEDESLHDIKTIDGKVIEYHSCYACKWFSWETIKGQIWYCRQRMGYTMPLRKACKRFEAGSKVK